MYSFLTKSYVEHLGLPIRTLMGVRAPTHVWVPENAVKPEYPAAFHRGVVIEDHTYVMESDGMAFARLDAVNYTFLD